MTTTASLLMALAFILAMVGATTAMVVSLSDHEYPVWIFWTGLAGAFSGGLLAIIVAAANS